MLLLMLHMETAFPKLWRHSETDRIDLLTVKIYFGFTSEQRHPHHDIRLVTFLTHGPSPSPYYSSNPY